MDSNFCILCCMIACITIVFFGFVIWEQVIERRAQQMAAAIIMKRSGISLLSLNEELTKDLHASLRMPTFVAKDFSPAFVQRFSEELRRDGHVVLKTSLPTKDENRAPRYTHIYPTAAGRDYLEKLVQP